MYEIQFDPSDKSIRTPTGKKVIQHARTITVLTSAQIKALFTTPIKILDCSAYGTDEFAQVHAVKLTFNPVTTAYTIGSAGNFSVKYVSASGAAATGVLASTGLIDQTVTTCGLLLPVSGLTTPQGDLYICLTAANPSAGDGTLTVNLLYNDPAMKVLEDEF